jgi:AbrB family looped-hinge helix DNA binding protein
MPTTLMSSKGQIIIPKALREARHWSPGMRLEVQETTEGLLLKPVARVRKTPLHKGLTAIRQRVGYRGPAVTLEEMDSAVLREAARKNPK